jgi:hypothetical protein
MMASPNPVTFAAFIKRRIVLSIADIDIVLPSIFVICSCCPKVKFTKSKSPGKILSFIVFFICNDLAKKPWQYQGFAFLIKIDIL